MSKLKIVGIIFSLFTKMKSIIALVNEVQDVMEAVGDAKKKESAGGKDITKEEIVKVLSEVEDVLTKIKEILS